jgi:hypothetical protein
MGTEEMNWCGNPAYEKTNYESEIQPLNRLADVESFYNETGEIQPIADFLSNYEFKLRQIVVGLEFLHESFKYSPNVYAYNKLERELTKLKSLL